MPSTKMVDATRVSVIGSAIYISLLQFKYIFNYSEVETKFRCTKG
jgi:hypothetical protein